MAKLYVYSVHDSKVSAFARPFFQRSRGEALRGWEEHCNESESGASKFPHDYALFELGTFDDETGSFVNHQTPENLGLAVQFKRASSDPAPLFQSRAAAK